MELIKISAKYLSLYGLKIPDQYFRNRILSHPNYPTLLSLTDTLDELGIEHRAMKVDKDKIKELNFPILAHLTYEDGSGDFEICYSFSQLKNDDYLYKNWDGIVLSLPANPIITNSDCNIHMKKNMYEKIFLRLSVLVSFYLIFSTLISRSSLNIIAFDFLLLIGSCISLSLILHSLGKHNILISKLCGLHNHSSCEIVKNSSGSKIMGISLEDAGFIYFTALLFYTLIGTLINQDKPFASVITIASTLSLPITLYSLYYQGWVVKKWCRICLFIIFILWIQFLVIFPYNTNIKSVISNINYQAIITGFILLVILIITYYFAINLLRQNKILKAKSVELLTYKRQPIFFLTLLEKQAKINDEIWDTDIILGNPKAKIRVIVACNPYCKPCADLHVHFHELLNYFSSEFCLIIRFAINSLDTGSSKFIAASYLIESHFTSKEAEKGKPISDWFNQMDIEIWKIKWGISIHKNYQELLQKHEKWSTESKVIGTPTIFINGFEYPKFYRVDDIKEIIQSLCNM